MILIDLQKAFDTLNHNILLKKMKFLGFFEETAKCCKSYLSNKILETCYAEFLKDPF